MCTRMYLRNRPERGSVSRVASLMTPAVAGLLACGVPLVIATAIASPGLARPGFSPDEELTIFAVRGVGESGLPTLPSSNIYSRGLPYTYLAHLLGRLWGQELWVYRFVSLLAA